MNPDFLHPPSQILFAFLKIKNAVESLQQATNEKWACFVGHLVDSDGIPNNVVSILDTEGLEDGRYQRTGEIMTHPGFQIIVRSENYSAGYLKVQEIRKLINTELRKTQITLDSTVYHVQCGSAREPMPMGVEPGKQKNRNLFALNGQLSFTKPQT